jgi:hypothetical protein
LNSSYRLQIPPVILHSIAAVDSLLISISIAPQSLGSAEINPHNQSQMNLPRLLQIKMIKQKHLKRSCKLKKKNKK